MTQTKTERLGIKPGDFFSCSWGYDQTQVNFYRVVRVTASKAEIEPVGCQHVEDPMDFHERVVPSTVVRDWDVLLGIERSDDRKSKLCTVKDGYKGRATIVLQSGRHWAYPWSGKPQYQTNAMAGH